VLEIGWDKTAQTYKPSKVTPYLEAAEKEVRKIDPFRGGGQAHLIISESGLYKLIMRSNKPQAKPFQNWVTQVHKVFMHCFGFLCRMCAPINNNNGVSMGLFSNIKDGYKKSEASAVLQTYFAEQGYEGLGFGQTPETLANKLVDVTWGMYPSLFNGSQGERPHKLSVAACSLLAGIEANGLSSALAGYLLKPFTLIMSDIVKNQSEYNFNSTDESLLDGCFEFMADMLEFAESRVEASGS